MVTRGDGGAIDLSADGRASRDLWWPAGYGDQPLYDGRRRPFPATGSTGASACASSN